MTELAYQLSIITRSLAALGFLVACFVLFRARRYDGPIVNAISWWAISTTAAQYWYIAASLMWWSHCCPRVLPFMWAWAWIAWTPCVVASGNMVYVLLRELWPRSRPSWWRL